MHKTLYVDIDEEITSIVDRVRKTPVEEVIVVVPKRALLIQSLVNLKLLKKEANQRKKRLMIVTQDRIGKKLIEKAGILVQGKMNEETLDKRIIDEKTEIRHPVVKKESSEEGERDEIGSSEYFDEPFPAEEKREGIRKVSFEKKKDRDRLGLDSRTSGNLAGRTKIRGRKAKKEGGVKISDIVVSPTAEREKKTRAEKTERVKKKEISLSGKYFFSKELERQRDLRAEKFFQASDFISPSFSRQEEKILKTTRVKGRTEKYFLIFIAVFFIFGVMASAYFFLPRSTLILHLATRGKSVSLNVEASPEANGIDLNKNSIPAAIEQITKEKSGEFEATGSQSGAGKAVGKAVIYNEFSSESQPLVATTRLETGDGKIFRITKNVVVPGLTQAGGEVKPGTLEVDVVADKPGEEYNIGPTTFKIPGFKGRPKYEKFYAKSAEAMEGGSKGETATVTSQDVNRAREELVAKAKAEALEDLKNRLGASRYFFEDTAVFDLAGSSLSEKIGSQVQKFTYTISLKARVLSFREEDVKELIRSREKADDASLAQINFDRNINYILAAADIDKGFLKFEAKTDISVAGGLDLANFKKGVLGKNSQELESFIKTYSAIKSADVNFWPFFVNRVPMNEKRVKVEIQ